MMNLNETQNPLLTKSIRFSLQIIELNKYLVTEKRIYSLADQILRSGTSVAANIVEAQHAVSKPDFFSKLGISLKEAAETQHWLYLLWKSDYIDEERFNQLDAACEELLKMLIAITKHQKESYEKKGRKNRDVVENVQ